MASQRHDNLKVNGEAPPNAVASAIVIPVTRTLTRRLYFAAFGGVYLIAFLSLWSQVNDLVGPGGLLPAERFFGAARERLGNDAFWNLPSLCWIDASDLMLHLLCGLGSLLCLTLIAGIAPRICLALLWVIYLSLCIAGQTFLSFQWDTLLLEMTLCSLFYAPRGIRPDWKSDAPTLALWPLWGLAFKLMFLSGVTKLVSGDSSWLDGTALAFHYYTQPLPSWVAWYAHLAPRGLHQISLFFMFLVEVLLPFLIFTGRLGRNAFGVASILLMALIEATGNFGFFNLQTIALCLPLLDDRFLYRVVPRCWRYRTEATATTLPESIWRRVSLRILVSLVLGTSFLTIVSEVASTAHGRTLPRIVSSTIQFADSIFLSWGKPWVLEPIRSFRTINGYGLFRVMTIQRNEFIVETSDDGETWNACEFIYKPGRVDRPPPIVAPHMPRLDWQMWFASLNPIGNPYWMGSLIEQILNGRRAASRLMGHPEWIKRPPRYVRLTYYEYTFATLAQRREAGVWWNRSYIGKTDIFSGAFEPSTPE